METIAMASSLLAAQSGALQDKIGAMLMKQNLDAEKFAVQTLLGAGAPNSLANVGAGLGSRVNIAA